MPKLTDRQDSEEVRALYGTGNYAISPEYRRFIISSAVWHSWNPERRKDHVMKFRSYKPELSDHFQKPANAGRKPNHVVRPRNTGPPDIIVDRHEDIAPASQGNVSTSPISCLIEPASSNLESIPNVSTAFSQSIHNVSSAS